MLPPLKCNPELARRLSQLRRPIAPIANVFTGETPPSFPPTLLHYFLLTEGELDDMAAFYSQTDASSFPAALTLVYPESMDWKRPLLDNDPTLPEDCRLSDEERHRVKARMFARFVGMRGCDTPRRERQRGIEILSNRIREVSEKRRNVKGGSL